MIETYVLDEETKTAYRIFVGIIHWVPGILSLGVKLPGREVYHSPSSSAEVKEWVDHISAPQYAFMAWCSVKKESTGTLPLPFKMLYFHYQLNHSVWW